MINAKERKAQQMRLRMRRLGFGRGRGYFQAIYCIFGGVVDSNFVELWFLEAVRINLCDERACIASLRETEIESRFINLMQVEVLPKPSIMSLMACRLNHRFFVLHN